MTNEFFTTDGNVWYYAGANGRTVTGGSSYHGQHSTLMQTEAKLRVVLLRMQMVLIASMMLQQA